MKEQARHLAPRLSWPMAITATLGTVLLGMLSGLLSGSGRGYAGLALPPATPPDPVFPVVWCVLYLMIGFSFFLILHRRTFAPDKLSAKHGAVGLWIAQLVFNLFWSFAFFSMRLYAFSFVWLLALSALNLALIIDCFKFCPAAGILLLPYEGWLLFACYLNLFIAVLN